MRCDASLLAVVTGGASGLGAATVTHLRDLGCPVISMDLPSDAGAVAAAESGAHFVGCDITDANSVVDVVARIVEQHGIPRLLVNCAGIAPAARTVSRSGTHDPVLFSNVVSVNLCGSFYMASTVAGHMVCATPLEDNERGVIINTASVAAYDGQAGQCAYAASKAGIAGMTLPLARDLASLGIRACAIAPGIFATPMVMNMSPEVQESLAAQIPFPKRLGNPAEYAQLVQHITENRMLNGEVIRLDGAIRMGAR